MSNNDFERLAIKAVVDYPNEQADSTDKNGKISADNVYIVWMVRALHNNKTLIPTNIPYRMYYQVTWNGVKNEVIMDAYIMT